MRKKTDELASITADVTRAAIVRGELLTRLANELRTKNITAMTNEYGNNILSKIDYLMSEIETLKGVIPICCNCKKVRIDTEYWQQVEEYVRNRSKAEFTHTFCPECYEKWKTENM